MPAKPPRRGEESFVIATPAADVVVRRKDVRNLNLRVTRDGIVVLSIPKRCPRAAAEEFVLSRQTWVAAALARQRERYAAAAACAYVTGDKTFLWGRSRSIRLEPWGLARGEASLDGDEVTLRVPVAHVGEDEDSRAFRRKLIDGLRRRQVLVALPGMAARAEMAVGVSCDDWRVRKMSSRWGSCVIAKRRIWISSELAAHPCECLDFVCRHELCHLIVAGHGPAFYAELDRSCPGWERVRDRLDAAPALP